MAFCWLRHPAGAGLGGGWEAGCGEVRRMLWAGLGAPRPGASSHPFVLGTGRCQGSDTRAEGAKVPIYGLEEVNV